MSAPRERKSVTRSPQERRTAMNGSAARGDALGSRAVNGAMATAPRVHCTLAPLGNEYMLLPTTAIAEVIEYLIPVPVHSAPEWFLGQIEWENRQIPVFSFAALISGTAPSAITPKARIMIVKSLSDSARVPYLGILINDIPRLVSVEVEDLMHIGDDRKSLGVFCHLEVQEQTAVIPDLDRLTHLVTHAAFGILPITQAPG